MRVWLIGVAAVLAVAGSRPAAAASAADALVDQGYEVIEKDPDAALRLFEQAAVTGSPYALNALGNYWSGDSGKAGDIPKARSFYERAEAAGYASATLNLGALDWSSEDVATQRAGCDRFQRVYEGRRFPADKRAEAAGSLGECLVLGIGRVADLPAGVKLLERADAAKAAEPWVLYLLGWSWRAGWGRPEADQARAFSYYKRSADGGNERAAWFAGMQLVRGQGVKADPVAARALLKVSAEGGNLAGQLSYAVMLATGEGGAEDDRAARGWYMKAAQQRSSHALLSLGYMLCTGEGGSRDLITGLAYMELAMEAGEQKASDFIAGQRELTVTEQLRVNTLKSAWLAAFGPPLRDDETDVDGEPFDQPAAPPGAAAI